jgi:hypothetical protein
MMQRRARRWFLKLSLNAIAYASDAPDGAAMAAEEASNRLFDAAFDPNRCYLELLSRNEVARAMQAELLIRGEKFNAGVWR